jgi:hypothetical protein
MPRSAIRLSTAIFTSSSIDGVVLAHGANAARVGTNQIDPDGKEFVKERVQLSQAKPELLAVV